MPLFSELTRPHLPNNFSILLSARRFLSIPSIKEQFPQILRPWYNLIQCSTWRTFIQRVNKKFTFHGNDTAARRPTAFADSRLDIVSYCQLCILHKNYVRFFTHPHYPQFVIHTAHRFIHKRVCPFYGKNQLYTKLSTLSTIPIPTAQKLYTFYRKILFLYTSDKL